MPFDEAIDFQEGPGILAREFREDGVPLLRLAGLDSGASLLEGCNYLDPNTVSHRWSHFRLEKGDILLSTSASLGRVAVVDDTGVGAIPYTGIIRMRPQDERLYGPFIRYLLEGPEFQAQAQMVAAGSVLRHFGPTHLRKMTVKVPPVSEQRAIAHVLGTLDERIDLNRRMNETLETMTRVLFKSWFINFDPVCAKMEGVIPGLSEELAQFFPNSMSESEGRMIPEGWEQIPLSEIADFLNGLALQRYPAGELGRSLPVIKIAELRNGISEKSNRASREIPDKYIVKDGDFLFSWSGSLLAKFWTGGEGALNQHLFKVTSEDYPAWFYSEWVQFHLDEFQRIAASKATTMGHIQRYHLDLAMTNCPPGHAINGLSRVIEPLVDRRIRCELGNKTLGKVRESLLPRLLRGELRVPSASICADAAS